MKPKVFTPKKTVDDKGYDKDGVLHDKCGTDECCNSCEPSDIEDTQEKDNGRI